ncbi:hypothetical protein [Xanthobacter sediminis]
MNALALTAASGWMVLAAAVAAAAGVLVLLLRAQSFRLPALVLVLVGLLVVAYGLVLLDQRQAERQALRAEELAIEARATGLDGALAASGLACMDALADMAAGCEQVVFARPETVAAARALLRARLLLLRDADTLSRRAPESDLGMRMAAWREPLARDPFGLVAVVLREDFSCADAHCAPARLLGEGAQAAANAANKRFETLYATHAARWNPPAPEPERASAIPAEPQPAAPQPVPAPESAGGAAAPPAPGATGAGAPASGAEALLPAAEAPLPPSRPAIPSAPRPQPAAPRPVVRQPASAPADEPAEEPAALPPGSLQ